MCLKALGFSIASKSLLRYLIWLLQLLMRELKIQFREYFRRNWLLIIRRHSAFLSDTHNSLRFAMVLIIFFFSVSYSNKVSQQMPYSSRIPLIVFLSFSMKVMIAFPKFLGIFFVQFLLFDVCPSLSFSSIFPDSIFSQWPLSIFFALFPLRFFGFSSFSVGYSFKGGNYSAFYYLSICFSSRGQHFSRFQKVPFGEKLFIGENNNNQWASTYLASDPRYVSPNILGSKFLPRKSWYLQLFALLMKLMLLKLLIALYSCIYEISTKFDYIFFAVSLYFKGKI